MVVADGYNPGPQRKRLRLSLKSTKQATQQVTSKDKIDSGFCDELSKGDNSESSRASPVRDVSDSGDHGLSPMEESESLVPAISSLENLGNTCFFNSILQVLRYTPGFCGGLEELHSAVLQAEKLQKEENANKEDGNASDYNDEPASWDFVKYLQRLYRIMKSREARHGEVATSDVMSMAVRPDRVLNQIRSLNPMFEGNLQHDAQELLKCMLCYLQDAEKDVHKFMSFLPPRIAINQKQTINPIMQRFLHGKIFANKSNSEQSSPTLPSAPLASPIKASNSLKPDILDQIEQSEAAQTAAQAETGAPSINGTLDSNQHSASITRKFNQGVQDQTVSKDEGSLSWDDKLTKRPDGRKGSLKHDVSLGLESNSNLSNILDMSKTENNSTVGPPKKRGRGRPKRVRKEPQLNQSSSDVLFNSDKVQPSILNIWKKKEPSCKRLGMRGAVVMRNGFENMVQKEPCPIKKSGLTNYCSKGESALTNCKAGHHLVQSSASKMESPLKHPMIKLEKCDHVCASPKKSVNAEYATKHLSPMKSSKKVNLEAESVSGAHCRNIFGILGEIKLAETDDKSTENEVLKPQPSPKKVNSLAAKIVDCINESKTNIKICENSGKINEQSVKDTDSGISSLSSVENLNGLGTKHTPSPSKKKRKKFVEHLFQGTMILRTRCLECESSREKQEEFYDISVPVRREKSRQDDDESDEEEDCCLSKLMLAFMEAERLRDENKYYCDKCVRYVEAERSLHFDTLPDILTLHLKRFTASSGFFGYVSKINDPVSIPMYLPCLLDSCDAKPCRENDHRYKLFALVTHAGMTLSSGHYLSYVHIQPKSSANQKLFPLNSPTSSNKLMVESHCQKSSESSMETEVSFKNGHSKLEVVSDEPGDKASHAHMELKKASDNLYANHWIECDDESIRVYNEDEFTNILSGEEGSLLGTPYVLFYHRIC